MCFYFVWHGETYEGRFKLHGQRDVLLSPRGTRGAQKLIKEYREVGIGAVACSDLARTREPASMIAESLRLSIHVDARLRECALGSFETGPQDIYFYHQEDPRGLIDPLWNYDFSAYGGESDTHVLARWQEALGELYRNHGATQVLVIGDLIAMNTVLSRYGCPPILAGGEGRRIHLN